MEKKRVFTEEELKDMEGRTLDRLLEAIEGEGAPKAGKLAKRMYAEFLSQHDVYLSMAAGFINWIYVNHGAEALYQALKETMDPGLEGLLRSYEKADFKRRVQMMAMGLRGHLQPITVEEDDEKVCIKMHPCGSGQRLLESGAYGPPRNLTLVNKPHLLTYGTTDFPVYCTHAPIMELASIALLGYPIFVILPADKMARESCRYCFYKDPGDIPEEIYKRVGKEKP